MSLFGGDANTSKDLQEDNQTFLLLLVVSEDAVVEMSGEVK